MAVNEQNPYIEYEANGDTTTFALGYECNNSNELIVSKDGYIATTGSWDLLNNEVIFSEPPSIGTKIVLERNSKFNRTTNYQSYDNSFRPTPVNKDFDRIIYMIQEIANRLVREINSRKISDEDIKEFVKDYVESILSINNPEAITLVLADIVQTTINGNIQTQQQFNEYILDYVNIKYPSVTEFIAQIQQEFDTLSTQLQQQIEDTLDEAVGNIEQGFVKTFPTTSELLAYTPPFSPYFAKAMDTRKIWRWNQTSAPGVIPVAGTWTDTGLSDLDQSKAYTEQYVGTNALSVKPNLTTENLNTVTSIGLYHQPSDANATLANNYPDTRAGKLEVTERSGFLVQEYTTWFGRKFWRTKQGANPMQIWQEASTVANFESKALMVKPNLAAENLNTVLDRGIYRQPSNANGSLANGYPEDSASGILIVYQTDSNYTVQEYTTWVGNKFWRTKYTTNNFTVWKKVATQAQIDEALSRKPNLATEDLNTVLTYGIYRQPSDANATLANNYPDTRAGTLVVTEGGGFVIQDYTTWFGRKFYRTKQGSNPIQPWQEYAKMSNIDLVAPYKGKNFAWFGDSLVNGNNHPNRIATNLQATVSKFGFNSCTMSKNAGSPNGYDKLTMYRFGRAINTGDFSEVVAGAQWIKDNSGPDFTPQANAMAVMDWNTVDYIFIAFGTNDWAGSTPLGNTYVADPNGETYIGAACYAIEQIQTRYPHIQIMLIGMPFRTRWFQTPVPDRPDQNSDNTPDAQGKILVDYENALVEIGKKYHVPVFEFNKRSDINAMTYTNYYTDGVHPKENGIQLWTKKIGAFLMNN